MTDGILIPVSPGELIDKLTILDIKRTRIADEAALAHVRTEHALLTRALETIGPLPPAVMALRAELLAINGRLWEIEDGVRLCEARQDFGERFVRLARSVYQTNDERSAAKRAINRLLGSALMEVKAYAGGTTDAP
ncbi:MAG: DUF6165 family protein [Alphaproteobacteria bacterium]